MIDQETLKTFDELYYDTYDYVLKYVVCNCSKLNDVEDIVQNVYMEAYKQILKGVKISNFKAYVLGIAKNKVKDYYRFCYKEKILSFFSDFEDNKTSLEISSDINIQNDLIISEKINFVFEYLKTKKIIVFKIFYLYYYFGLTIKEISKELGTTESNVKHNLYRTLGELKNLLESGELENA